jgi:hypothetical protein
MNGAQLVTHVTRTRLYQDALLQTAEDIHAAAHFNNTLEFVVDKYSPLSKERTTGELCVLTRWRGFDEAEDTKEPLYDKCVDTPRMLKEHLQEMAENGDEMAIKGLEQIKDWEDNLATISRAPLATSIQVAVQMRLHALSTSNYLLNLCFAMGRSCV